MTREEALAQASQASRPQRAPEMAFMGFLVRLIGGAAVLAGCGILFARAQRQQTLVTLAMTGEESIAHRIVAHTVL